MRYRLLLCCAALAAASGLACNDPAASDYQAGIITIDEMHVERAVQDEPSILFIDAVLKNRTAYTVNNVHESQVSASTTTRATFNLAYNELQQVIRCPSPQPWDVPPGGTNAIRLRIDFRADPAILDLACDFDPAEPGFDYDKSRRYTAPRTGPSLAADFSGPIAFAFKATLNSPCASDACPWHAVATGSAQVNLP